MLLPIVGDLKIYFDYATRFGKHDVTIWMPIKTHLHSTDVQFRSLSNHNHGEKIISFSLVLSEAGRLMHIRNSAQETTRCRDKHVINL